VCLNSKRYQILFSLWCTIPSGRALKKRFFALISLIARGLCVALHVSVWLRHGVMITGVLEIRTSVVTQPKKTKSSATEIG
jgi:hypothetical protein